MPEGALMQSWVCSSHRAAIAPPGSRGSTRLRLPRVTKGPFPKPLTPDSLCPATPLRFTALFKPTRGYLSMRVFKFGLSRFILVAGCLLAAAAAAQQCMAQTDPSLVAAYNFNEGSGTVVNDLT